MVNLHEDLCTFMIVFFLNSSENKKCFGQKLLRKSNPHFILDFFFFENRAVCEIM